MRTVIYPWQQRQWQQMLGLMAGNRMPHAMLFSGIEGTGMADFAGILAGKLLCHSPSAEMPCGDCKSCVLLQSASHPDLYSIAPEETGKQIKVEDIRELIGFIQLSSQYSRYKIAIINPADAMNRNAANALLKTLEEPPPNVLFILVCSQPDRLPVTIRSRCQRVSFSPAPHELAIQWLQEMHQLAPERAGELLNLVPGKPLAALELSQNDQSQQQQKVLADLARLSDRDVDIIGTAQRWHDYGAREVLRWIMGFLSVITRIQLQSPASPTENRDLQRIANDLNLQQLVKAYALAMDQYRAASSAYNLNRVGLLEDFIIQWQSLNKA